MCGFAKAKHRGNLSKARKDKSDIRYTLIGYDLTRLSQ